MKNFRTYEFSINIFLTLLFIYLIIFGKAVIFIYSYILVYAIIILRTLLIPARQIKMKTFMIILYSITLAIQIMFVGASIINYENLSLSALFLKFFGALVLLFPFIIERSIINHKNKLSLPRLEDVMPISYNDILESKDKIIEAINNINKAGKAFSVGNISEFLLKDLPRHNSFKYINKGILTKEYFEAVNKTLKDPYIYIAISNSGSLASEMVATFTRKIYNHVSISFDKDLKTIVSYNGGERVTPPGLNHETMQFFNQKEEAAIIVYRLKCNSKQKKLIMNKIKEINDEGSAYNLLGILLRRSYKPNIMVCSHFVYKMLSISGLKYFDKKESLVIPSDFVELDYHRKLEFAYELKLNKK